MQGSYTFWPMNVDDFSKTSAILFFSKTFPGLETQIPWLLQVFHYIVQTLPMEMLKWNYIYIILYIDINLIPASKELKTLLSLDRFNQFID